MASSADALDKSTPAAGSALGLGDDQIRALKLLLQDVFGLPDATSITNEAMNIAANGGIVINDTSADIDFRVEGDNNANMIVVDAGQDAISFGGANVDGAAAIFNNLQQRTHVTSVGSQIHVPAQTTDFDNPNGTIAIGSGMFLGIPTWTNANATLTMTDLATLYIQGAPVDSTNVTATNTALSLWIDDGASRFDGDVTLNNTKVPTTGVNGGQLNINSTEGGNVGVIVTFQNNSATPADNDLTSRIAGLANDSGGTSRLTHHLDFRFTDVTSTEMDSEMRFGTMLAVNAAGANTIATLTNAGVWTDASAAASKEYEGFRGIDLWGMSVVNKLKTLNVGRYHPARVTGPKLAKATRHISPTAEDLYDNFGIGEDPRNPNHAPGIAPKDLAGIALMAIQELIGRVEILEAK